MNTELYQIENLQDSAHSRLQVVKRFTPDNISVCQVQALIAIAELLDALVRIKVKQNYQTGETERET